MNAPRISELKEGVHHQLQRTAVSARSDADCLGLEVRTGIVMWEQLRDAKLAESCYRPRACSIRTPAISLSAATGSRLRLGLTAIDRARVPRRAAGPVCARNDSAWCARLSVSFHCVRCSLHIAYMRSSFKVLFLKLAAAGAGQSAVADPPLTGGT